jgi:hypothetical protein
MVSNGTLVVFFLSLSALSPGCSGSGSGSDVSDATDLEAVDQSVIPPGDLLWADAQADGPGDVALDISDVQVVPDIPPIDPNEVTGYPLDDVVQFHHVQALGTHNSYHKEPLLGFVAPWGYTHRPLDEQLGLLGVRQFELDLQYDSLNSVFQVFHIAYLDKETTCDKFVDCLGVMKSWSDQNPGHHPFVVMLELKNGWTDLFGEDRLAELEEDILSVWPVERILTPDDVQKDAANLRDAIAAFGWPTLGEVRGRIMFVLHESGDYRNAYTQGGTTTEGCLLFPDAYGDTGHAFAAFHSMNDPQSSFEAIQTVVGQGHLVRTRADSDSEQAIAGDLTRYYTALASGAHFISTDYPEPHEDTGYVIFMPGGTPSRCNPITTDDACTSATLEHPGDLAP